MNKTIKIVITMTVLFGVMAFPADVSFEFNNLEKVSGKIYLSVINDPEIWNMKLKSQEPPEKSIEFKAAVMVGGKNMSIIVNGLKPGVYAAQIFHDLNENGKLDTNALGIPKEPYGFSNNKKGIFGKPKFKKVSFVVKDKDIVQKIKFF